MTNSPASNEKTNKAQLLEHAAEQWVNLIFAHITSKNISKKIDKRDKNEKLYKST